MGVSKNKKGRDESRRATERNKAPSSASAKIPSRYKHCDSTIIKLETRRKKCFIPIKACMLAQRLKSLKQRHSNRPEGIF